MIFRTDTKVIVMAALADGPKHGYAVAKRVRETSEGLLKMGEGQLYPALYALEAEGWVVGEWDEEDTNRRVYRLTEEGRAELERRASKWHEFASAVARVLPHPEGA
jgi:DNA-binding PadR family transcriptional regulator